MPTALTWWSIACAHRPSAPEPLFDPTFTGEFEFPSATVVYYTTDAPGLAEARAAIGASAPRADDGRRHRGLTEWSLLWHYRDVEGTCIVDISLDLRVTLPRWTAEPLAEGWERELWQREVRSLAEHERRHVDVARDHAAGLASELAAGGCTEVDSRGRAALDELRRRQEAVDRTHERPESPVPTGSPTPSRT